jgi:adenine-specific DNA-methyltransferase
LSPAFDWDRNPSGEVVAFLMACIEDAVALPAPHTLPVPRTLRGAYDSILFKVNGLTDAVRHLWRLQTPFLNWSGKAERLSFGAPTLRLFVHERLPTTAIIETLTAHRRKVPQADVFEMFADPQRPMVEQVRAFEHCDQWVNRIILGDSLVVMNGPLRFEGLGGHAQCMFIDRRSCV